MNELNMGMINITSLAVCLGALVVGLVMWFFVNRASNRANEQIALLEALLDQQKRQNALLRRLCEANEPEVEQGTTALAQEDEQEDDFVRLVAER